MAISMLRYFVSIEFFNREYLISTNELTTILKENLGKNYEEFIGLLVENLTDFKADHEEK